jgi:ABC-type sugar transport system substrate-binding protein
LHDLPPQNGSRDLFQDPVGQGEESVNAAYLMVRNEPNPKAVDGIIWIPYQKVTKETISPS